MTLKTIEKSILRIAPANRMRLVETILNSLNEPNPEIERAWIAESEKRYSAFKRGKSRAISFETLKKQLAK
jgi:putative addiction module component (TIGR02574 family)